MSKNAYLQRAKEHLSRADDGALSYAALELRRCIEAIVYEKLQTYSGYVPGVVFEKWQPAHALKTLLQFEPEADDDFRLRIAEEDKSGNPKGPWIEIGEHRTLKIAWLDKNYNKLGSFLHVAHGIQKQYTADDVRAYLGQVVATLDRVLQGAILGASLAPRIEFECQICGSKSLVHAQVAEQTGRAFCINPNCGAAYRLRREDDQWQIDLEATEFKCQKCESSIWLEDRHLNTRFAFKCPTCQTEHVLLGRQWAYATREEVDRHAG